MFVLPIPHLLLFVPLCVFALLVFITAAANAIAGFTARRWLKPESRPALRASAQIIYLRPRKTYPGQDPLSPTRSGFPLAVNFVRLDQI